MSPYLNIFNDLKNNLLKWIFKMVINPLRATLNHSDHTLLCFDDIHPPHIQITSFKRLSGIL